MPSKACTAGAFGRMRLWNPSSGHKKTATETVAENHQRRKKHALATNSQSLAEN